MLRLESALRQWVDNNLITSAQAQGILVFEGQKGRTHWAQFGFLGLGATAIGIGIISIIAANWMQIPDAIKLFVDFLVLCLLAFGIVRANNRHAIFTFEVLLVLFALTCMGSVGLISQVFHLSGKLQNAAFFWSVITFGVSLSSQKKMLPLLWVAIFLSSLYGILFDSKEVRDFFGREENLAMTLPLLTVCFAVLAKEVLKPVFALGFYVVAFLVFLGEVWMLQFLTRSLPYSFQYFSMSYFLSLFIIATLHFFPHFHKRERVILSLALLSYLILAHIGIFIDTKLVRIIVAILGLLFMSAFFVSRKNERLFSLFLALTGIEFVILYFEAFGGLAWTGAGLIMSGLLILGLVYVFNKYRQTIQSFVERVLHD